MLETLTEPRTSEPSLGQRHDPRNDTTGAYNAARARQSDDARVDPADVPDPLERQSVAFGELAVKRRHHGGAIVQLQILGIRERLNEAVQSTEIGNAECQLSARRGELEMSREDPRHIAEMLDEPDREHQLVGPRIDREEIGVMDRSCHPAAPQILTRQQRPLLAVLDPLYVRPKPLGVEDQPLRRRASDLNDAVGRAHRGADFQGSGQGTVERLRQVNTVRVLTAVGTPVILLFPEASIGQDARRWL